jgi:hypothetical protein
VAVLVAEGERVHEQPGLVRIGHQRGGRGRGGVGIVDLAVLVQVDRLAVGADGALDAYDVALPGPDAVGVLRDLGQPGDRIGRTVLGVR